jgi:hypothetical protein
MTEEYKDSDSIDPETLEAKPDEPTEEVPAIEGIKTRVFLAHTLDGRKNRPVEVRGGAAPIAEPDKKEE